jgi:hypothetical protein
VIGGTDIAGTWDGNDGDSGSWAGQTTLCPTAD